MHEGKARAPAGTEMSSQECKVQGLSQNRTPPQGMPVQERTKTANLVQTPPQDDDDTHIDEIRVRQPNPRRINMLKTINHIEATGKAPQISNCHTPQGTLQAP